MTLQSLQNNSFLVFTGQWQFTVHSRTASYNLYTNSSDSAWQWTYAIQDVIDSKPPFETPFQILVKEISVSHLSPPQHGSSLLRRGSGGGGDGNTPPITLRSNIFGQITVVGQI